MEKFNVFEDGFNDVVCDGKSKEKIQKELLYCANSLGDELAKLSKLQSDYFNWLNSRKDIINSMRKNLPVGEYIDIIDFGEIRNQFLCKEIIHIKIYLSFIKKMNACVDTLDEVSDIGEIESIETKLVMMMTSLGLEKPIEVFGEQF